MTANEFKSELKQLAGGYLFCGEEDYLKRHYLSAARDIVVGKDDFFNRIIITQDNYSPSFLMSSIESLPVMNEKKFIEVLGLNFNDMKEQELDEFIDVLQKLPKYEYNVLVVYAYFDSFDIGTPKKPSKVFTKISSVIKPVIFSRETPARLASWVSKHFSSELIIALPDAVNALLKKCGNDMSVLASEIQKLCWYLKENGRDRLTEADVELVAADSKETIAFEFTDAILNGRVSSALSILNGFRLKKEKPEIILSGISKTICDMYAIKILVDSGISATEISQKLGIHSYRVGIYIKSIANVEINKLRKLADICYDADIRIKFSTLDSYSVLDRLAVEATIR